MFTKKIIVSLLLMVTAVFMFSSLSFADELSEIQAAIKAKGARWVAGRTSMMMLTPEERRMRLGLGHLRSFPDDEGIPFEEKFAEVPATFDWRNIDGNGTNYVTPIRNQSSCGSCWAFAATAGLESYTLMTANMPNYNLDLAEQILISCYNTNGCSGGSPSGASYYIMTVGLPLESCFPYRAYDANDGSNSVLCSEACDNWEQNTYIILDYGSVSKTVSALKEALVSFGPLVTTFNVYSDFYSYNGGIYSYTTGTYQGGHAVLIVGYDEVNQYFIVKNSWGTGWGESGYFKIDYNELNTVVNFGSGTLTYYGSLENPTIMITSPTSSSTWQAGTTQTIHWVYSGNPGSQVKIDLLKSGLFDREVTSSTSISTGSFDWTIPVGLIPGSDYQIVVTSTLDPSINDTSDNFSITPPPPPFDASGSVRTVNGVGISSVTMTFTRSSGTGSIPSPVQTDDNGNWYQTGFQTGTTYRVTPSHSDYFFDPAYIDFTNESSALDFTGTKIGITILYPNGGEDWQAGSTNSITWSYAGTVGNKIMIELLKNGTVDCIIIKATSINNGFYKWSMPSDQTAGTDYKIRITSTTNPTFTDTSDNNFTISGSNPPPSSPSSITVTSPAKNTNWQAGTTQTISWTYTENPGPEVKIELLDKNKVDSVIATSPIGENGSGSYSWQIPVDQTPANKYRIKVTSTTSDTSDASDFFTISQ